MTDIPPQIKTKKQTKVNTVVVADHSRVPDI